jgi:hypothetical protein
MKLNRVMVLVAVMVGSLFLANSVQAYVAGDLIWGQAFNFQGCNTIEIRAVAASSNSLIVCGTAYNSAIDTGDLGFIKAFDQVTGQPKWEQSLTAPPEGVGGQNRNTFNSLTVMGSTVLVEGYSSSYTYDAGTDLYTYTLNQSTLRAYNADTGGSMWGPINQNAAPQNLGPTNIVAANNRVFVVRNEKAYHDVSGTTGDCIVQAYQVGTPIVAPTSLLLE